MPIEIRELIIRTTVTGDEGGGGQTTGNAQTSAATAKDKQAEIVAECVEQVMEILREERER
jgi:hypothetical protein